MIGPYLQTHHQNIDERMNHSELMEESQSKCNEWWEQKFPSSPQQHRDHCQLNNNHIYSWNRMRYCGLPGESNLWKALLKRGSFTPCRLTWWERDTRWDLMGKSIWVQRNGRVCGDVPLWCGKVVLQKSVLIARHPLPPAAFVTRAS